MSEIIEQREELQGILFVYRVEVGNGEHGWRWSVDILIGDRRCNACEPTEYTTKSAIGPPGANNVPEPSEDEWITDGFIHAQQWVLDYLLQRDWAVAVGIPARDDHSVSSTRKSKGSGGTV